MFVPIGAGRWFVCVAAVAMLAVVPPMPARVVAVHPFKILDDKAGRSWPMFGGSPGRNMVNAVEQGIPDDWCVEAGKRKNVRWVAELGSRTFGSPVIAEGRVFVGANNAIPRDPRVKGPKAVLMAFREADGEFLWQIAHDLPSHWSEGRSTGALPSTPAAVGGRLYYLTPAAEVICAETDTGKVLWRYDMANELKVHTYRESCHGRPTPTLSSPLVVGELVFAVTGNGTDEEGKLVSPNAPSFVALDRRNGKLAWQSNLPGANVSEGQWSSPTFADPRGRPQVIFAGGDGVIYSFAPESGKLLWRCDCLPTRKKKGEIDLHIVGTPVVLGDRLYVGLGLDPEHPRPPRWSHFLCLDITKEGDVSLKSYDANSALNKDSALVWAFGGPIEPRPEKGRDVHFGPTPGTAAVHDGLVYITEESGYLHCLDAATGIRAWVFDFKAAVIGSPYWVDGRVFVGTQDGELLIFAPGRRAELLARIDMETPILTTPVAVNGTLYVATESRLFAIGSR